MWVRDDVVSRMEDAEGHSPGNGTWAPETVGVVTLTRDGGLIHGDLGYASLILRTLGLKWR